MGVKFFSEGGRVSSREHEQQKGKFEISMQSLLGMRAEKLKKNWNKTSALAKETFFFSN